MNIYDFVYLGKVKRETAVKMLSASGKKYVYNPTLPEFKSKPEPFMEYTWQEKLDRGIPLTPDELKQSREFGAKVYARGKTL